MDLSGNVAPNSRTPGQGSWPPGGGGAEPAVLDEFGAVFGGDGVLPGRVGDGPGPSALLNRGRLAFPHPSGCDGEISLITLLRALGLSFLDTGVSKICPPIPRCGRARASPGRHRGPAKSADWRLVLPLVVLTHRPGICLASSAPVGDGLAGGAGRAMSRPPRGVVVSWGRAPSKGREPDPGSPRALDCGAC